jgi:hypothetical protein
MSDPWFARLDKPYEQPFAHSSYSVTDGISSHSNHPADQHHSKADSTVIPPRETSHPCNSRRAKPFGSTSSSSSCGTGGRMTSATPLG